MHKTIPHLTSIFVVVAAAIALSACGSSSDKNRAAMAEAELDALQEAYGQDELTPDAITALRNMIATLMGRAEIAPADLQALRDQVAMLMGRVDIAPAALQALRDQVAMLEGRADIMPADLRALRDQVAMLEVRLGIAHGVTVPTGLVRSPGHPLFESDDDESALLIAPTLASGIRRNYDEQRSDLATDAYIKSLGFLSVETGDDEEEFTLLVTYVVGDEEVTIPFTDADLQPPDLDWWERTVNGVEYWGYFWDIDDEDGTVSFIGGIPGYRLYATAGLRTDPADLPSGTAVYEGSMFGDTHLTNDPSSLDRQRISGSLRLTADFDQGSLEGSISNIEVRGHTESQWTSFPTTTHFAIDNGQIVDGQFTASVTGMDSNANAPMDETVRGYEGGALGEFYGPDADSVGGVLNASREDRVMAGVFAGAKQQ